MSANTLSRRWHHYAGLLLFSAIVLAWVAFESNEPILDQLSIATAYICILLMAVALIIGPLRSLVTGSINSVTIYLRRDIGIWTALSGFTHLYLATVQSMNRGYIERYVDVSMAGLSDSVRSELFLWGSIAAFIVGILLLLLLCLSSDAALRFVGVRWWKRLQRSVYVAFALTIIHGIMFQLLEGRAHSLITLLVFVLLAVLILQTAGLAAVSKNTRTKKE